LARLQKEYDVAITWRAFELRPRAAPPISPEYRARIEAGRPRFAAMAREQYGLEINAGPFGIDSRPALIGEQYAVTQGCGDAYHDAVADAYWLQAQSIDNREVLADLAESVGLERAAFRSALDAPEYAEAVDADIAWARQRDQRRAGAGVRREIPGDGRPALRDTGAGAAPVRGRIGGRFPKSDLSLRQSGTFILIVIAFALYERKSNNEK
jgi:protein-disulfide isomerase-like protein with CxxC motif